MRLRTDTDTGIATEGVPKATSAKAEKGQDEGTGAGYNNNRFLHSHGSGRKENQATWQASGRVPPELGSHDPGRKRGYTAWQAPEQGSPETAAPEGEQKPTEETSEATRAHPRQGYSGGGVPSAAGGRHGQTEG